jgi:hypothetical protein
MYFDQIHPSMLLFLNHPPLVFVFIVVEPKCFHFVLKNTGYYQVDFIVGIIHSLKNTGLGKSHQQGFNPDLK